MVTRHERCVALGLSANATNRDVVRLCLVPAKLLSSGTRYINQAETHWL